MKNFIIHIGFAGNCEEALNFYKECLSGAITSKQTYGESPVPVKDDYKSKIMHAEFEFSGIKFMAADFIPDNSPVIGNNIGLTIDFDNETEQTVVFNKLSSGGTVTMPLQDTFWNAKFGMITDKFGINWMLNYTKPQN
jgi:PhnB protein